MGRPRSRAVAFARWGGKWRGKLITAKTTVFGRVSGIEAGNGVTTLMMGKVPVKMEDVINAQLPVAA